MRKRTALIVCLTALAALVVWLVRRDEAPTIATTTEPGTLSPATSAELDRDPPVAAPTQDAHATRATASTAASGQGTDSPFFRVIGRVVDEHGSSISNAAVRLHAVMSKRSPIFDLSMIDEDGQPHDALTATTRDDGRFVISARLPRSEWVDLDVEPGPFLALGVLHFGPGPESGFRRLVSGDNDVGDITLSASGTARGRLVTGNGEPFAGARVANSAGEEIVRNYFVVTDATGLFVLGHLPVGKVGLTVGVDGKFVRQIEAEIQAGETTDLHDVQLPTDFAIMGVVVDRSGAGLPGIGVFGASESGGSSTTKTRADGSFTLWFDYRSRCSLKVIAPQYDPWEHDESVRYELGTTGVRIVLDSTSRMTFRVVDAHSRRPIERFGIALVSTNAQAVARAASEDAPPLEDHPGGEVTLGVPRTEARVLVHAPGHAALETNVEVDAADPVHQTLALAVASSLRGRVISAGKQVSAAMLMLMPDVVEGSKSAHDAHDFGPHYDVHGFAGRLRTTYTALDGSFAFDDLSPGTYMLQMEARGAAKTMLRGLIVPPENVLDLGDVVLAAGAVVRGVVTAGENESPRGFNITLDGRQQPLTAVSDARGNFEIAGIAAGKHTLTWTRPSESTWSRANDPRETELDLAAGEIKDVTIDASSSAPCKLVVHVVHRGAPKSGVVLRIRFESGSTHPSSTTSLLGATDAEGRIESTVDGDAQFTLLAETTGEVPLGNLAEHITAVPGGVLERTFVLRAGHLFIEQPASLQRPDAGVVDVDLWGADFASTSLRAYTPRALMRPAVARIWQSNTIDFGDWPPGDYQVRVRFSSTTTDETDPTAIVYDTLRGPFTTNVHVVDGEDAHVAMP